MLSIRNKLFRNHESTVLPVNQPQKVSGFDVPFKHEVHQSNDVTPVSFNYSKTPSLKLDTSSILQCPVQGTIAQLKTRHFNHLHMSNDAHESMTPQRVHWLSKILHLPSTEISQFNPEEILNFEQDHKGAMLLIRLDEYHEMTKIPMGHSRIFVINVASRSGFGDNLMDHETINSNNYNASVFLQGCKIITSKKTSNLDAFVIAIPNGSPILDITIRVYAKPKISKAASIRGAIKTSKAKAKTAYQTIITKLSPTASNGNNSLLSEMGSHYGHYASTMVSPTYDREDNMSLMSSSRHSNVTGMSYIRQHPNPSDDSLCNPSNSQLDGRQVIANVTFHQEINSNMFHQPSIQLQLTSPSDNNIILAEMRLGVAVFLNRQDWMDALTIKEHQNNILLAKELYPTISYSDYLTVQIHQPLPKNPIWSRYWAILQGFHISLFDFQYKETRPAEFILELKHIVRVKKSEPEKIMQPNSFVIVAENGTRHYVFSDSESSRQEWMKQIEAAIKRCRPTY